MPFVKGACFSFLRNTPRAKKGQIEISQLEKGVSKIRIPAPLNASRVRRP